MKDIKVLKEKAKELRETVIRMTSNAGTGHVTSSFSCMEILVSLFYGDILKYNPKQPNWGGRDYFILSKGHANPVFYAILADVGYIDREELDNFCKENGKLGVLLRGDIPGSEIVSGSLGCGLGIACGIAEALKIENADNRVFCMLGDAECREGAVWEAAMHAGYRQLDNIVVIVDKNDLGATHFVSQDAGIDPIDQKWEAFGFNVIHIDGHSYSEILDAFEHTASGPTAIIADTIKGKGVSFIENQPFMHGVAVKKDDMERAIREIQEGDIG